jgi:hypothetical protein
VADLPQLLGVRDHESRDMRLKDPRDRKRARAGLKRHVIVGPEALGEQLKLLTRRRDPTRRTHPTVLSDRDLARPLTDVYPDEAYHLSLRIDDGGRVGGRDDNDGYVRAAHPGQVAGAATEKAGLTAHRTLTAYPTTISPSTAPVPEPATLRNVTDAKPTTTDKRSLMPGERAFPDAYRGCSTRGPPRWPR